MRVMKDKMQNLKNMTWAKNNVTILSALNEETSEKIVALADELAKKDVVIATEVGGGIVPVEAAERAARERAGRLNCLLSKRADTVIRVFCGIPMVMKGELP